jgi:hypothetical protein
MNFNPPKIKMGEINPATVIPISNDAKCFYNKNAEPIDVSKALNYYKQRDEIFSKTEGEQQEKYHFENSSNLSEEDLEVFFIDLCGGLYHQGFSWDCIFAYMKLENIHNSFQLTDSLKKLTILHFQVTF